MSEIIYSVIAVVVLVLLAAISNGVKCSAQWKDSGMEYRWGPLQGCMIQKPDSTWIPATAYREVDK